MAEEINTNDKQKSEVVVRIKSTDIGRIHIPVDIENEMIVLVEPAGTFFSE